MTKPIPLVLGGIEVDMSAGPVRQRYESMGGSSEVRLSGGVGVKMTHWARTVTSVNGAGQVDPGTYGLDYSEPLELLCVQPRSMFGTDPVFTLPAASARRADDAPWAWVQIGGQWHPAAVAVAGDVATVVAHPDATAYRLFWLPRLVVYTDGITSEFDESSGIYSWSFEAREV